MEYSKISNVEFDNIRSWDAPDYVDAFIVNADYDGEPMTDEQLDELNDDSDLVYALLINHIY